MTAPGRQDCYNVLGSCDAEIIKGLTMNLSLIIDEKFGTTRHDLQANMIEFHLNPQCHQQSNSNTYPGILPHNQEEIDKRLFFLACNIEHMI